MKVHLVYPDIILKSTDWPGYYYHGVGFLATSLKRKGHEVTMQHLVSFDEKVILEKILKEDAGVIGFSTTTNQFPYVEKIAARIKEIGNRSFLICGGVHPTLFAEQVINSGLFDAVCVGEGEEALVELCERLDEEKDISSIPSLWIKQDSKIIKNPVKPLTQNLDELGFPDRAIFDYPNLYHERTGVASVMASRGCPYRCTYCCNEALSKIYNARGKQYARFISVPFFIQQLKQILCDYSFIKGFSFDDDILPLDIKWFDEFTNSYKSEINLPFTCNIVPNLVNEKVMKLLKHAGCVRIHFGIESGSQRIRQKIFRRNVTDEKINEVFELADKYKIKTYTYNMVGVPTEKARDILDTIKVNTHSSIEMSQVTFFYPYQGTVLGEMVHGDNLVDANTEVSDYFAGTRLKFTSFHKRKISFYIKYFSNLVSIYQKINSFPYPLSKVLTVVVDTMFSSLVGICLYKFLKISRSKLKRFSRAVIYFW